MKKKIAEYEVGLPIAHYRFYRVFATSKREAIRIINSIDCDAEIICIGTNKKWSQRILARKIEEGVDGLKEA